MGEMKLVAIPGWLLEIIEKYHITRFAKVIVMWDSDDNPEIIAHRKHSEEMEEMNVWIIYDEEGNVKDFPGIDYLYDDTELNIYVEPKKTGSWY